MTKRNKPNPPILVGTQRLPNWKFEKHDGSAEERQRALEGAMRSSRDDRLTLDERRRALAAGLGLAQAEVTNLDLPGTLARLDDALGATEQVIASLKITLPPEVLEQLIEQVTAQVVERLKTAQSAPPPKMLTVKQAAGYLGAKPQRIYDLLSQRRLTRYKDGGRTLVSREELEAHVRLDAVALTPKR